MKEFFYKNWSNVKKLEDSEMFRNILQLFKMSARSDSNSLKSSHID